MLIYKIVKAEYVEGLENIINAEMSQGWQLHGVMVARQNNLLHGMIKNVEQTDGQHGKTEPREPFKTELRNVGEKELGTPVVPPDGTLRKPTKEEYDAAIAHQS